MSGAETETVRATPAAAFVRARQLLREGTRLDMASLATDIGVSRATLYRWSGDRERLLADVVWTELSEMIDHFDRSASGTGVARMTDAVGDFLDTLGTSPALQAFLVNEGDSGLRMVTALDGGVRPRLLAKIEGIITREAKAGYRPPAAPILLADGILSLAERWLYHHGDPALNPDPATARRMIGLLLRE
jgi:AcrR family transcriptional regulator